MVWLIISILAFSAILAKNPKLFEKVKGSSEKLGLSDPKILIAIGIVIFNLISWLMIPWWWKILTYTIPGFVIFNVGFWTVLYLRTIKVKGTNEANPTASKLANIIAIMLIFGLATTTWQFFQEKGWPFGSSNEATVTPGFSPQLGGTQAESVSYTLAVLDGCETGTGIPGSGRHFLDDGVTPVRNPQDAPWGTGAVGRWQINMSDPRVLEELKFLEADMKADGRLGPDESLDVERNEAHNRAAAEYLHEKYGTAPWTASVACWADKITMPGGIIITLEAPIEGWSEYQFKKGFIANIEPVDDTKKYREEIGGYEELDGIQKPFSVVREFGLGKKPEFKVQGVGKYIRFQSLEKEPVIIKITLTPKS